MAAQFVYLGVDGPEKSLSLSASSSWHLGFIVIRTLFCEAESAFLNKLDGY